MRTIRVTGKGQLKLKPDTTRITVTLEGVFERYEETMRRSGSDTEQLRELIKAFEFEKSDLKTLSFHIETEYRGYEEDGVYKQRLVGYRYRHVMKLEFDSDNDRLGRILYALANSPLHPEFILSYTVKDPESAKNQLLGNAVADAKAKAAVIADAACVTLKDIQTIDYSWGRLDFEVRPMEMMSADCAGGQMMRCKANSYDINIEPDDIDVSDTVTVVWEIG